MNKEVEKEYTKVTIELLNRTDNYKNSVMNDMVINANRIIRGIDIFQEVLKEINPIEINDEMIEIIKNTVIVLINTYENESQMINSCVRYGIRHCFMILDNYGMIGKRRVLGK